ncbi:MAG: hypothetical protein LWX07_02635 [Bacteroidetes bacterium]|nr:hypothetical protein [Bacteroidota bacterium]
MKKSHNLLQGIIAVSSFLLIFGFRLFIDNPSDNNSDNKWKCIGPFGQKLHYAAGSYYSGRIYEFEIIKSGLRIASETGGIFQTDNNCSKYEPIADNLGTLVIGSFVTNPDDENTIFVGTGNCSLPGIGLWKTKDRGKHWDSPALSPVPNAFYKICYTPSNLNKIHAVTDSGYYRSDDGGETWERHLSGLTTDLAINSKNPKILYTAVENQSQSDEYRHLKISGVYKSEDGGDKWERIGDDPVLPNKDIGRTSISMYEKNPSIIYVSVSGYGSPSLKGVYKTDNDGKNWKKITPSYVNKDNSGFYQGAFNNYISVSPVDPDRVLLGWASLSITKDGGNSWKLIEDVNVHADHHAITWDKNGKTIYEGNDGGFSLSTDAGEKWSTAKNTLPISQFYGFDVSPSNGNYLYGTAIDDGICGTSNMGSTWYNYWIGDCASVCIDPENPLNIFYAQYGCAGPNFCSLFKSTNGGINYQDINKGVDTCGLNWDNFYTHIKNNNASNFNLYVSCDNHLYISSDKGGKWKKFNPGGFHFPIGNFAVAKNSSSDLLYVCLMDSTDNKNKLKIYENGSWDERSGGLPKNSYIKFVTIDPKNSNTAYALMSQADSPSERIFITKDKGKNWENITGNMPDVPLAEIIVNPENEKILYLGTSKGCYKTIDGGKSWERWNNGLPEAVIITEMRLIEKSPDKKKYVAISTYGRSIWIIDVTQDF